MKRSSASVVLATGCLLFFSKNTSLAAQPGAPAPQPTAQAAPERPTLSGPPFKRPTLPAAWKVTTQAVGTTASTITPTSPVSVSVLYTKTFNHETIQYKNGETKDLWIAGGFGFLTPSGSDTVTRTDEGIGLAGTGPALEEFHWLRPDAYRGTIELGGDSYLIFVDGHDPEPTPQPAAAGTTGKGAALAAATAKNSGPKWPPGPIAGLPLKPGIMVAAVNEKTRLPKYLQRGSDISQYEFSTPDAAALQLPQKIQQAIKLHTPKPVAPIFGP